MFTSADVRAFPIHAKLTYSLASQPLRAHELFMRRGWLARLANVLSYL